MEVTVDSYLSDGHFRVIEYDETKVALNSTFRLKIINHYPLEHTHTPCYTTHFSEAVTHIDTDQIRRCLSLVIVPEGVFFSLS